MTAIVITYICMEKIGFNLPYNISLVIGFVVAAAALGYFLSRKAWFDSNVRLQLQLRSGLIGAAGCTGKGFFVLVFSG